LLLTTHTHVCLFTLTGNDASLLCQSRRLGRPIAAKNGVSELFLIAKMIII